MFRFAVIAACVCALAGAAAAQGPPQPRCRPAPPPFALTAENQIKGKALLGMLAGKTLVYLRPSVLLNGMPGITEFRFEFREDGSMAMACKARPEHRVDAWRPCAVFGPKPGSTGDRDVGTWRVKNDRLVLQRTRFGEAESQVTLHARGGALAVRRIAGAPCLQGPVALE